MSSRRRRKGRKKAQAPEPKPVEFWRSPAPLPSEPEVAVAEDPSATLRSLGPPPLPGQPEAQKHIVLVAARAAGVATALAAAAEISDQDSEPVDEGTS